MKKEEIEAAARALYPEWQFVPQIGDYAKMNEDQYAAFKLGAETATYRCDTEILDLLKWISKHQIDTSTKTDHFITHWNEPVLRSAEDLLEIFKNRKQ